MDSHRNYPPDQPDGQWYQQERGYPDPEWDRRGGDPRYAPPADEAQYAETPGYGDQAQQYGNPGYGEHEAYRVPEPRGGYQPEADQRYAPEGDQRYAPPAEAGAGSATGRVAPIAPAGPLGPRSGEPLPPKPPEGPVPPRTATFGLPQQGPISGSPQQAPISGSPHQPPVQSAPTSGLPQLNADRALPRDGGAVDSSAAPGLGEADQAVRYATEPIDRASLRRPSGGPGQLGDGVYRSRRPGTAVALTVITVLFEAMALRLFGAAFFSRQVSVGGSIASAFLILGLPMFGLGLYGLLSGAAAAPGAGARAWLKVPLVYLPVALALFLAAGLAAA